MGEIYKSVCVVIGVAVGAYRLVDRRVDEVLMRIVNGETVIVRGKRVLYAKKIPSDKRRYRVLVVYEDGTEETFLPSKFLEAVWKT